jgi:hypothetical protein
MLNKEMPAYLEAGIDEANGDAALAPTSLNRVMCIESTCATGKPVITTLLIGFGGMSAGEIEPGIALLSRVCF